ncbi:MAG TPA: hypothetical protein VNR59_14250, partial [Gaiellaceae bacterium]|nr:hypothetical protein [Gaiellaceae bacterium]
MRAFVADRVPYQTTGSFGFGTDADRRRLLIYVLSYARRERNQQKSPIAGVFALIPDALQRTTIPLLPTATKA